MDIILSSGSGASIGVVRELDAAAFADLTTRFVNLTYCKPRATALHPTQKKGTLHAALPVACGNMR